MSGRVDRRARTGRHGEALAAVLLVLRGHRILGRRVRTPAGEVDIVCRRGRTLVVVEVKRRRRGGAREALGPRQAARLVRAASWLAARESRWARRVRIDLVAIDGLRATIVRDACADVPKP